MAFRSRAVIKGGLKMASESLCIGLGRKMLITDNADYALPDLRELRFY